MNKDQTVAKLEEIIYTYENKTESNKLSEFEEGRLSAFRFSLNLIKKTNLTPCFESDSELLLNEKYITIKVKVGSMIIDPGGVEVIGRAQDYKTKT